MLGRPLPSDECPYREGSLRSGGERRTGSESLDKVIWIAVIITAATGAAALLATFIDAKLQGLK